MASSAPKFPAPRNTITPDAELVAATAHIRSTITSLVEGLPPATTALQLRANNNAILASILVPSSNTTPSFPADALLNQVTESTTQLTSFDGQPITLTRFATAAQRTLSADGNEGGKPDGLQPGPPLSRRAVLYIHGGGFISGSVAIFAQIIKRNVLAWDTQVFAVSYRLAPENPAPGPAEDAYAALAWLSAHAPSLGVDPARIVLVGESAGGGVAAGLALLARDRALSPPLAKVVLVYPMLDDRTIGRYGEGWPVRPFLSWNEVDNRLGWGAYLGEERAGRAEAEVSVYDAPGRAGVQDLVGLPKMYVDVGGLDLFRDEDVAFVARLLEANVETEFHLYPGVPHGFESAITPGVVKLALENRKRAICLA